MSFDTALNTVFSATMMPTPMATTIGRMAEGEEEPEAERAGLIRALPFAITFRVVLSMAEMWSASKACRRPRV